jgi:hypothetical protein
MKLRSERVENGDFSSPKGEFNLQTAVKADGNGADAQKHKKVSAGSEITTPSTQQSLPPSPPQ